MIKVSIHAAPRSVPRAALATCEIVTAATIAHSLAGGGLPSVPWLVGLTCMVFGASLLVIRELTPLRWALPALVTAQFVLHHLLAAMATEAHEHGHATDAILGLSWHMLAAHVASGMTTALVWHLRRRLLATVIHCPLRLHALPFWRLALRPLGRVWVPNGHTWLLAAPRRGPPAGLRCA